METVTPDTDNISDNRWTGLEIEGKRWKYIEKERVRGGTEWMKKGGGERLKVPRKRKIERGDTEIGI